VNDGKPDDWILNWDEAWIARCRLSPGSTQYFASSIDAWSSAWVNPDSLLHGEAKMGPTGSQTWPSLLSWVPFVLLVILRLWIGWMARPEVQS
jgi:hypothetical protein